MRRPAAVLSATLLSAALIAGSIVGPASVARAADGPVEQITCGTVGPPACDLVQQLTAVLKPLGPLLDLAGPALGDLGQSASVLTDLLESGPSLSTRELQSAVGDLLDQLNVVTGPVTNLLKGAGLDLGLLDSVLSQLQSTLADLLAPVAPAPAPSPAPAPAPTPPAATGPSGGSAQATSAGGAASFDDGTSTPLPTTPEPSGVTRGAPDVPNGSSLNLAPLGLPDFRFAEPTQTAVLDSTAELPFGGALERAVEPAASVLADAGAGDSKATAVVVAIATLMLAAGLLIDQQRRAQALLPIKK